MNKIFIMLIALMLVSCAENDGDSILDEILSEQESIGKSISSFVNNLVLTTLPNQNSSPAPIKDLSQELDLSKLPQLDKRSGQAAGSTTKEISSKNQNISDTVNAELGEEAIMAPEDIRIDLLYKARKREVDVNDENLDYFCKLSSQLVFYTVNNLVMDIYNDGKNIKLTKPTEKNRKLLKRFGLITIKNSFAYKALRITQEKQDIIRDKLGTSLPFDINLFDDLPEQYQYSYYGNCSRNPKKYIFNYNRIFKYKPQPKSWME